MICLDPVTLVAVKIMFELRDNPRSTPAKALLRGDIWLGRP